MNRVHGILVVALSTVLAPIGSIPSSAQDALRGVIPPPNHALQVLKQNWSDQDARWFYGVAQGSRVLPYKWFLHLELADSRELYRSEKHVRTLGYLPRRPDTTGNEDGLPVGFTRDVLDEAGDGDKTVYVGLTCAACHTGQVQFQGKAWLIDGAPTLGNLDMLQRTLVSALQATLQTPDKFDRFFGKVIGTGGATERDQLKAELKKWIAIRQGYIDRNQPAAHATPFGPGRVDAFGAILNEVTVMLAEVPANRHPADAPVSYPFIWDTPQHDRVQWNGVAKNLRLPLLAPVFGTEHVGALGRNTGEVLGVFGRADAETNEFLIPRGYPSSVNMKNLIEIEESVRKLWSPQWPAELGAIDATLKSTGKALFDKHCLECHAQIKRDDPDRQVVAKMSAIGTDPLMARNFATRQATSGVFSGRFVKIPGIKRFPTSGPSPIGNFLVHAVQRVLLDRVPGRPFTRGIPTLFEGYDFDYSIPAEVEIDGRKLLGTFRSLEFDGEKFKSGSILLTDGASDLRIQHGLDVIHLDKGSALDKLKILHEKAKNLSLEKLVHAELDFNEAGRAVLHITTRQDATIQFLYKGRPLNGIWATAPYLHNGSVPNLDELLKPAGQRVKKFHVGSHEFDRDRVGYRSDLGDFEYDTSLPGNSNAGHEYGEKIFTADERKQLIEYMKSL